jgi:hypothetical protein
MYMCVVTFTLRPFTPGEKDRDTYWIEACVLLDVVALDKFILIRYLPFLI